MDQAPAAMCSADKAWVPCQLIKHLWSAPRGGGREGVQEGVLLMLEYHCSRAFHVLVELSLAAASYGATPAPCSCPFAAGSFRPARHTSGRDINEVVVFDQF
jgi:hypothetical protein